MQLHANGNWKQFKLKIGSISCIEFSLLIQVAKGTMLQIKLGKMFNNMNVHILSIFNELVWNCKRLQL